MTIKTENWLGEYTSTIGIGDIILGGAIDGFADFSNVGENVDVYYTVMDALDKETGIGTITGGKLVRKDIHATLVAGVYVKNGSAISLSGDAQVYGTANAHFLDYVQSVANAEIANTQAIAELKALQINGHALTESFNLAAADVGAHPDSWMPSTEALNVYQKDASDIRYIKTQDAEQVPGLVMRVGGPREQQLKQSIDDVSTAFIGDAPPAGAPVGKRWFDTESGRTYIKYNDGDSTQWVEESPQGNGVVDTSPDLLAIVNGANQYTLRNRIHNPTFKVTNRASTATTTAQAPSKFFADRWVVEQTGTGSATASVVGTMQDKSLPFQKSAQLGITAGITAVQIRQTIEAANMADIPVGAKVTFSAYIGSQSAGAILALEITGLGIADDYANAGKEVAYSNASFATTGALVSDSNVRRYSATFTMTEKMRNGTTVKISCSSPSTTNNLYISGLQLEVGALPTALENRQIGVENDLCERYFQSIGSFLSGGSAAMWQFQTMMRITPTVEFYPVQGTGFTAYKTQRGVSFTAMPNASGFWEVNFIANADF